MANKTLADKINDKVIAVRTDGASKALTKAETRQNVDRATQTAFDLGRIVGVKQAADYLGLQSLKAMENFIAEKGYLALGFPTVTEFFKSDFASIKKSNYYDSKKLVGQEGEELYEIFEEIGAPKKIRLLLGPGNVRLEGDSVVIGETRIPKDDPESIMVAFKTFSQEVQTLKAKTEKQDQQIKQGSKDLKELRKQLDQAKRGNLMPSESTPHDRALMFLVEAFKLLADEAEGLSAEDVVNAREKALTLINQQRETLLKAYRYEVPELDPTVKPVISKARLAEIAAEEDDEE